MSETVLYILILVFTILSVGLAFFVWKKSTELKIKKQKQEASIQAHAIAAQEQKDYLIDSIRIISRSIYDGQCPMAEGCIRLKVLIDNYAPQLHQQPELQVVELMYSKTAHIPTLEAWKRLSSKEKIPFQEQLNSLEQQYSDEIRKAALFLKDYAFDKRVH